MARHRHTPTRDELNRKLDSMRPPSSATDPIAPVHFEQDEITGLIHLALERASVASASSAVEIAALRLIRESGHAGDVLRSLLPPPETSLPGPELPDPGTDEP